MNARLDISSIDLSAWLGPFVAPGDIPIFEFTLFDNPGGAPGLGSGTVLSSLQASGTASAQTVFDWTEVLLPLDASKATDGNVILRIDLLSGGYAAFDNLRIAASNTPGDVGDNPDPTAVPEPTTVLGLLALAGVGVTARRSQTT
ncbi:MAG: PEP-CTERM sorting domain-containing protein [Leptolyngbya sp. RL_3_1]|nr:PEP-CTERM sorting domain-containing protein [Leptolyngbya sp. RL_3_1]